MEFVSVRTATIRPDTELMFDVYVLFQDSYLKYRSATQSFNTPSLDRFKAKKVKKIYIPQEQETQYLSYLDKALEQLQKKDLSVSNRAELAQDTLKQEADSISKTLESEEAYRSSESRIQQVVDFMISEPKALAGMLTSAGLSVDDSAHGSTVSSLVLAVGTASKYMNRDELTDAAVAGLLHDSALKKLGFDVKSDITNISKEKRIDFKKHPAIAVEQVAGKQFITPRVLRIITDHEEYGEGLGFPEKKWFEKLQVDSQIFNLCDAFDHFSIQAGKASKDCFDDFVAARGEHFDMDLIQILEQQVKA